MKAIILAAGKSERLSGVCGGIPKVMLPVRGRSILEHNLIYLKKWGVRDVIINLHYRPEVIRRFIKKHRPAGMKIVFSEEKTLMGTAGAIKKVATKLNRGPFLVLYGDNLTDFDISKLMQVHHQSRAAVTLGLYNPLETRWSGVAAGLVQVDKSGRIRKFVEKKNNQIIRSTSWVNAGIMIVAPRVFRYIPRGRFFDFAKDLFPVLLRRRIRMQSASGATYVFASDTIQAWQTTERLAKKMIPKHR